VTTQATPAAVRPLVSLRTELLLATALLAAAAVAIAVVSVVLFAPLLASESAGLWLTALILGDVLVFVAFLRHQVERLVLRPLGDVGVAPP
jgi:fatty acid desaturase